ncbi:hypothetical protein BN134_2801 [Cronobacter dublinensis 1210]|uniref:Uncharacterized protein n=1 Tax=Cronobacter dublinensis 1210 TaxID=1208656 RepID=A0ABP1WAD9_9ENTR|nr:hypothetical protein BN134_2801 [Cronobacter dublinensis 1210]
MRSDAWRANSDAACNSRLSLSLPSLSEEKARRRAGFFVA